MSSIPGGGEGLFARKDLEADLVVCFYNGIRIQVNIICSAKITFLRSVFL